MESKENRSFYIDLKRAVICEDEKLRQYLVSHLKDALREYFREEKEVEERHHFNKNEIEGIRIVYQCVMPEKPYYLNTKERNRYNALCRISEDDFVRCFESANFTSIKNDEGQTPYFIYGVIWYFYNEICGEKIRKCWIDDVARMLIVDKGKIRKKGFDYYKELKDAVSELKRAVKKLH